ncbi:GNAT family N-acetyltransferase [Dactylosporangium aurantiacum]|uniref:GNAT family N-acetyltransferase n=1 Tax=Dactylosporangium aurantiacum TaxID=35754 RepID=A0A9Q9INB8_9ACTN|nr:bifunctional GNAT family N-acetyltransferase/acetate--CoA ligase family protein [Dactylosporangium aurantiacum]MDG6104601.1 GNAT family N-acetyltransferase [Dactylosporangium aurantiacum]UWZ56205.1 GNAT family N-acetyltransferase [Dactylosporangium aurantiacum]
MTEIPDRAADVLLSDGTTVHLRPIRPDDADRIVALHSRFSERTRYLRYFSAYPRIPQRDLDRFVNVDHHDREAFVVEHAGGLIAVGRYERLGAGSHQAEVAFVVEDAHQGRGIGSVLIEHLVAAASQEGITEFEADVLPVNQAMLRVFMAAGFHIEREFSDGVVHLWFPIAATPDSMRVQWSREQRAEARSIGRLLNPRGVAVYGARADGTGVGAAILAHLKAAGPAGPLVPVHPSAAVVGGLPAVAALAGSGHPVDLAVVAVPAEAVPSVVADCSAAGVHGLVVVSAGFAESGPVGAQAQAALLRSVRSHGMRLVGPNCLGIANTDPGVSLNATLAPLLPRRGRVGFFSQSAALGTALLAEADRRGLGLSTFVSAGNRADVSGNDALQYWREDPHTDAVLLYLETFGNPRKFARIARELARRKPVAAVASPVRPPALDAVTTGPDARGVAALFASSGVIRVDTVAELFDVGLLIAGQPLPTGDRIAVVTNAAALGVLTVAKAPAAGLRVAEGYPRDLGPEVSDADFVAAVREALADDGVDAVVAAYAPALSVAGELGVADLLRTSTVESARPLAVVLPADPSFTFAPAYRESDPAALPTYPAIEEAVRALGRVARYAAWRREPVGTVPTYPGVPAAASTGIEALLAAYGVPVVPSRRAAGRDVAAVAAELGLPVALKVATGPWRHRIDLGAVRLNLTAPDLVEEAYQELERLFGRGVEVLVQPMVAPGVACVVEVVDDPAFGPVVGFGLGGEAADLLGDRAWRPAPLTDRDAAALVRAPRAAPLLTGYRGAAPVDLDALADLLLRVGRLVDDQPTLSSLSLNPILARPQGLAVLHAAAEFTAPVHRPDSGPRRLY